MPKVTRQRMLRLTLPLTSGAIPGRTREHGDVEGRVAGSLLLIDIGALAQKVVHDVRVPVLRCQMQRCVPEVVLLCSATHAHDDKGEIIEGACFTGKLTGLGRIRPT